MAWQLIYTSAPRSLEAGRSGFGTVARHRAISPLLVSAIERASQFSRLPGTDAGRVIFSHRIVAVAGGRFHVLSAIRDAGADYTGRTNHIAHHLIVDPREIAQLGPDGPSPADVLLAMRWAASWNESPRFLEASDEVSLSAILPHTNGSAWEQITGNANQAWLLATGDASRGAYIIQPGSADLREVFAESLRLIPDRLWQISFTTSLQPSDEPGDFRWIGIEERSPLRAQSESSGRPVLNLALPDTLPLVETVQRPAVSQIRQNSEPASAPAWNDLPAASTETSPVVSGSHSSPTRQRTAVTPSASSTRSSRISPKWWLLTGAVVAVSIVGMVVFSMFVNPYLEKQKARNAMAESFATTGYFSNDTSKKLANALVISADDPRCKELAGASNALIQILLAGDLQKLKPEFTSDSLKVLASRDGLQLPEELGNLRETVKEAQRLSDKPPKVEEARDINDVIIIIKKRHDEITEWAPGTSLQELVGALHANANQQQAEGMLTIVQQRMPPPGGIEPFKQIVATFKSNVFSRTARTMTAIEQIEKLLVEHVTKSQPTPTPKPEPVKPTPPSPGKSVNAEKPAPIFQVPLYFVNGKESLSNFRIEELRANSKLFLKQKKTENDVELTDQAKNNQLRPPDAVTGPPYFELDISNHLIRPVKGAESLTQPFRLSAKNAEGADAFQLWVIAPGEAFFHSDGEGLHRNGDSLEFVPSVFGISGSLKNTLSIKLPDSCFVTKSPLGSQSFTNWSVDLSAARKQMESQQEKWSKNLEDSRITAGKTLKDNRADFENFAAQLKILENEKRDLAEPGKSLPERCGGYIMAISRLQKSEGSENLFTSGERLKNSNGQAKDNMVKTATEAVRWTNDKLGVEAKNKNYKARLAILGEMLKKMNSETQEFKANHKAEIDAATKQIDAMETLLRKNYPLTSKSVPPGDYRIYAKDGGTDMLLVEIHVSQPGK